MRVLCVVCSLQCVILVLIWLDHMDRIRIISVLTTNMVMETRDDENHSFIIMVHVLMSNVSERGKKQQQLCIEYKTQMHTIIIV